MTLSTSSMPKSVPLRSSWQCFGDIIKRRVEMLKAHIPQKSKSPGVNVNVNPAN